MVECLDKPHITGVLKIPPQVGVAFADYWSGESSLSVVSQLNNDIEKGEYGAIVKQLHKVGKTDTVSNFVERRIGDVAEAYNYFFDKRPMKPGTSRSDRYGE